MTPEQIGQQYNEIATWWHERHQSSQYGVNQVKHALDIHQKRGGLALDVGCGSGGRFIHLLEQNAYQVTGVDVSEQMISLAQKHHHQAKFIHADICQWQPPQPFDFIMAWDSIFHLPLEQQKPVIDKLCQNLVPGGVIIYTFGDAEGAHSDTWLSREFYYSSIGINRNITQLMTNGLTIKHLSLDQYPEPHVFVVAQKN